MNDKQKIRQLKKEIEMLNNLIALAKPSEWNLNAIYKDILNGNPLEGVEQNKAFAKWFANRFGLEEEENVRKKD